MSEDLTSRLSSLIKDITFAFFNAVCRGLFEKDKQVYALLLCVAILKEAGNFDSTEWKFFLTGASSGIDAKAKDLTKPDAAWISDDSWAALGALEMNFKAYFQGVKTHVRKNLSQWSALGGEDKQHEQEKCAGVAAKTPFDMIPEPWSAELTAFQKVLLIRAIDDTKLLPAITEFVGLVLGAEFKTPPSLNLKDVLNDSVCDQPLLFLCSSGADPTNSLLQLAKDNDINPRVVSLGQGQGPIAESHMDSAMRDGDWVLLQNCHLAVSFLGRLAQIVEEQMTSSSSGTLHPDFRLWLTSMPTKAFPASILQSALKMSVQPPKGIRANMLQSFASNLEQSDLDKFRGTPIDLPYRRLLYGLTLFHALALERRKFGGLGWNKPYEWMASDLKTAVLMSGIYCDLASKAKDAEKALSTVSIHNLLILAKLEY
eukprot:g11499.t1